MRQIDPPPTHDTVLGRVRSPAHPFRHLRLLIRVERPAAPRRHPILQPVQAFGVVAMPPVAQGLAIHPALLGPLAPSSPAPYPRHCTHPCGSPAAGTRPADHRV